MVTALLALGLLPSTRPVRRSNADSLAGRPSAPAWSEERQQAFAAASVAASAVVHAATVRTQATASADISRHYCSTCSLSFAKAKQLHQHLAGKRHAANEALAASLWTEYRQSSWWDSSVPEEAVASAWSLDDFLAELPRRSRSSRPDDALLGVGSTGCLSPHLTLCSLPPAKRARLWRYLRELMPSRPALPEVFHELGVRHGRFARVKEILESCEVYRHAEAAVLAAEAAATGADAASAAPPLTSVFDAACGHGLVGLLLAYRFPWLRLASCDLSRRPAYDAYLEAWEAACGRAGEAAPRRTATGGDGAAAERTDDAHAHDAYASTLSAASGGDAVDVTLGDGDDAKHGLANVRFVCGDFAALDGAGVDGGTLVLCVHGCNEANAQAVELARAAGAAWLVVPCCLQSAPYVDATSLHLPDDVRYAFLCGAMARRFDAERVACLDRRVTARAIVLSSAAAPAV